MIEHSAARVVSPLSMKPLFAIGDKIRWTDQCDGLKRYCVGFVCRVERIGARFYYSVEGLNYAIREDSIRNAY